jgi:hypothetical protein
VITLDVLHSGSEDKQAVERRLGNSVKELQYGLTPGNFDAVSAHSVHAQVFLTARIAGGGE